MKYAYDSSGNIVMETLESVRSPQITGQPVKQVAEPGEVVTFSVVVADVRGVTFQWRFNGADIPGAIGDSLLLTNISAANEGQYSVVVTNSAGSVTSAPAALMLDSDGDGLPDSWELANFGDLTSQRSAGDPDRDSVSNIDEFIDSTNPTSNASLRPRLVAFSDAGGLVTVAPMKLGYDLGETVTLTAEAFSPSMFVGWAGDLSTGDLIGTTNPVTFRMDRNKTVRARFGSAMPPPPGLVALWRGETDATDLIGGHDGTAFAGTSITAPSVTASGKVGGAFNFDGTVHVRVPDSAALKPAQITVEAWVFPTVQGNSYQTVIARGSSIDQNDTWYLGVLNGQPHFWTFPVDDLAGPVTIPLNEWTHLAASFDGTAKRLYVNGAEVASRSGLGALVYDVAAVPVTIGSDWASNVSNARFHGRVDEVAIYNRALTADEVTGIYNADFMGKNIRQPYFTSPSRLPDVDLGASYTQQLMTILGEAPVRFSVSAGALPQGMTLSSAGVVSGVPSTPGIFDFTALGTDAAGLATEQLCVLRVLQPVELPADLIAWWRGEPATDNAVVDHLGGHNGAFFSGSSTASASYTPDGRVGSAFAFNGTLYVQIPDAMRLRPKEMTAEGWVFPTVQSGNHQAIIARGSRTDHDNAFWMGIFNGKPRFWSKHIGTGVVFIEAPSAIPLKAWTHIAISFGGLAKRLYVNGLQVAMQGELGALIYESPAPPSSPPPLTIGADWGSNAPVDILSGRVDEVSLYDRTLSAAEIFGIADAGSAGKRVTGPYINSPSQLPVAIVGQAYAHTFTAVRETGPVEYSLQASSALPSGLTLSLAGVLSGVPTNAGPSGFVVRVTDAVRLFAEQRCAFMAYRRVSMPAGALAWWKAEGNALDSAGLNHGTLLGGSGFATGMIGQAFSLNGSTGFIEIPDSGALRPASLTLEAWVAFDATSGVRVVFVKLVGDDINTSYSLWLENGTLRGAIGDATAREPALSAGFSSVPGRWYHLAYTFDDNTKRQTLYRDGLLVAFGIVTKPIGYDSQPLLLGRGRRQSTPTFFFQGSIDEPSIYNRALDAGEIAALYKAGPAGKQL